MVESVPLPYFYLSSTFLIIKCACLYVGAKHLQRSHIVKLIPRTINSEGRNLHTNKPERLAFLHQLIQALKSYLYPLWQIHDQEHKIQHIIIFVKVDSREGVFHSLSKKLFPENSF